MGPSALLLANAASRTCINQPRMPSAPLGNNNMCNPTLRGNTDDEHFSKNKGGGCSAGAIVVKNNLFPGTKKTFALQKSSHFAICPEIITELRLFRFLTCKTRLRRKKLILPNAQVARNYGTKITFKSLVKSTAAENNSRM